jgi:hypothetical protein
MLMYNCQCALLFHLPYMVYCTVSVATRRPPAMHCLLVPLINSFDFLLFNDRDSRDIYIVLMYVFCGSCWLSSPIFHGSMLFRRHGSCKGWTTENCAV